MKRQITAILLAGILLTGCGNGAVGDAGASGAPGVLAETGTGSTAEEETGNFPGGAGEAAQETAVPGSKRENESVPETDTAPAEPETGAASVGDAETETGLIGSPDADTASVCVPDRISYIYEGFCSMSLALPEGWAYRDEPAEPEPSGTGESEEEETPAFRYGIRFWAEDFPEDTFGLYYYPDRIGMCGTGVTIEPVTFANGLTGTSYTEQISDGLWRTVIYDCPDGFAGSVALEYAGVSEDMLAAHKIQLEEILESVQIGG